MKPTEHGRFLVSINDLGGHSLGFEDLGGHILPFATFLDPEKQGSTGTARVPWQPFSRDRLRQLGCKGKINWVWVKIKPPGDRRFWSTYQGKPFWVPILDPPPTGQSALWGSWHVRLLLRFS